MTSNKLAVLRTLPDMVISASEQGDVAPPPSLDGRLPVEFLVLIKLSKLQAARKTPHSTTCFVTPWQPTIRSRRPWQGEMSVPFRKYSQFYLWSNRLLTIDGCAQLSETLRTEGPENPTELLSLVAIRRSAVSHLL